MKFSVVMPVHNEERFLPYSLPSVFKLQPDEVILIFDRCKDKSVAIARKISEVFVFTNKTKFIELNEPSPEWRFRLAFLRRYGFKIARNEIVLNSDADTILDQKISTHLNLMGNGEIALLSFGRRDYPITIQSMIARLVRAAIARIGFARERYFKMRERRARGIYAFSKEAWLETENEYSVREAICYEDAHLSESISKKYNSKFIETDSLHLRPLEGLGRHFAMGSINWNIRRYPMLWIIPHSIFYFRPLMLAGYLQARLRNKRAS